MKRKISIVGLVGALVIAALIGGTVAHSCGNGAGLAAFVLALAVPVLKPWFDIKRPAGFGSLAALQKEVWQDHIEGNMFKDNEFLLMSTDASQYTLQGKVVHIPQAGGLPTVEKDRSSLPATVQTRTDTDVTYTLSPYTSDPILIPNAETYELSYSKRESVLAEHENALRERTADEMLIIWAPTAAGNILRTTGDSVAPHITGQTGNRLKVTTKDLKAAQKLLNKQKVPKTDRYCLMSADMYDQFTDSMTESQYRDFSAAMDVKTGVVGMLFGFKIMQRSDTVVYNTGATAVNAYGAVVAATDNDAVLCWQKDAVERAVGDITFFEHQGDPTYYGDVYSFEVRFGGRKRRDDQKGIVAIVQAADTAS
jgi:hypothetical protein